MPKDILAKSKRNGGVSLYDHTLHTVKAIEHIAKQYDLPADLARKGAVLHDLGKAHACFQIKMNEQKRLSSIEERKYDFIHRHELSSLAFLPAFPQEEWDQLIDMIVAHHKSIRNDNRERGILDIKSRDGKWIDNHLIDWEEWSTYGIKTLNLFGYNCKNISIEEAKNALSYALKYCDLKKNGWSKWRGLLMSADYFASALTFNTEANLRHTFEIPDLSFYRNPIRQSTLYPLSMIPAENAKPHTIVVAPTGAGKTDFLIKRCRGRIFYTLPFQASINAMWERMKNTVPNKDIRILHAISQVVVGDNLEERVLQPLAGSAIKVLTPHQLAAIIFGTLGYEAVMLDVKGCDIILDEIHTYSDISKSMVLEIVKALIRLECRIHIGTATMPTVLYNELLQILGGPDVVYEVKLDEETLDTFDRHEIDKIDEEEVDRILEKAISNKEKILLIYNTVNAAQKSFKKILEEHPQVPTMLIHSRFRRKDRIELEEKLKREFNGDGSEQFGTGTSPCIVVSTQVVEVSLDISFDRMITQSAPLDSLIQRFGRINRVRKADKIKTYKPIHVIRPGERTLPYNKGVVESSFDQLPDQGNILKENSLQSKIDIVYPHLDVKEIDVHLINKDGRHTITELTNKRKAVLTEILEIESMTCILESDRDAYCSANPEDRIYMEIPISWRMIRPYVRKYEQLFDVGNAPFVIPQKEEDHILYGLELVEHENII